jgi:hypothetical protein
MKLTWLVLSIAGLSVGTQWAMAAPAATSSANFSMTYTLAGLRPPAGAPGGVVIGTVIPSVTFIDGQFSHWNSDFQYAYVVENKTADGFSMILGNRATDSTGLPQVVAGVDNEVVTAQSSVRRTGGTFQGGTSCAAKWSPEITTNMPAANAQLAYRFTLGAYTRLDFNVSSNMNMSYFGLTDPDLPPSVYAVAYLNLRVATATLRSDGSYQEVAANTYLNTQQFDSRQSAKTNADAAMISVPSKILTVQNATSVPVSYAVFVTSQCYSALQQP